MVPPCPTAQPSLAETINTELSQLLVGLATGCQVPLCARLGAVWEESSNVRPKTIGMTKKRPRRFISVPPE
jgi:hypothetical protein